MLVRANTTKITRGLFCCVALLTILLCITFFISHKTVNAEQTIEKIMNHPMHHIAKRCLKDHNYTDEDMVILEKELKRYLALSLVSKKGDGGNGMYSADVDNLWHAFILFTKEYAFFCEEYFGHFIHHAPRIEDIVTEKDREEARDDFRTFVTKYEELFGEEIHPIWLLDSC